ncbi:hypothetical protein [Larkinella soli]|uniref:hypothetical protein n=1 Tax=Larkinella soli TaxID=1770527 RepID=UPI000FFB45E7|nr:hypothetical protein [Larkinella soli]
MKRYFSGLILLALLTTSSGSARPAPAPLPGGLKPGPFAVGFQVFNRYDRGRYLQPKTDFEGRANPGENAFPIQISVWYPAAGSPAGPSKPSLLFEEYLYLNEQKQTFRPLTDEEKNRAAEGLRALVRFGAGLELTDADLLAIRRTPTAAHREARPASGPFPVIVSGLDGGPASASVMYEYLASHGYVVLATPGIGRTATLQASRPQLALHERIDQLEYVLAFAHSLPTADPTRLGVLGINFDGMSGLLFQMKNMQADAVVSLDGWEGKNAGSRTLRESPWYAPVNLRVPYLVVIQDEKDPRPDLLPNREVFDALVYSERYFLIIKEMNHAWLVGNLAVLPNLPADKRMACHYLFAGILNFFQAHVKKDPAGLAYLKKTAPEKGFPAELLRFESWKAAFPAVPTPGEFETLVMAGEVEKAARIYREAVRLNPSLELFDEQTMHLYAFRFSRQNRPETVLSLRRLAAEAFPKSVGAQENLGLAWQAVGRKAEARACFEKAARLVDADGGMDPSRKDRLRKALADRIIALDAP